ncbi:MAG: YfhO family protein [Parasporobacterium sp.]|nr:YfhO family protein [Parasporobacterium sp.]
MTEFKRKNQRVAYLPVVLAFVIPIVILLVIFVIRDLYPLGDSMYLRSDCYHQYAPFLKLFRRCLVEGSPLTYTWDIGLGTNLSSTYAYYLASPLNWFAVLFPENIIPEVMEGLIIIKTGLAGATTCWYLQRRFNSKSFIATAGGICFAMSSYMVAFSWNVMWVDCLVLLPLILYGVEQLVKKGRGTMYTVTLAIAILSNYYIAIMICIFLVLYFVYLLICERDGAKKINVWLTIWRFAYRSLLAGMIAAITVVPAIMALSSTASGNFNFPSTLTVYFNLLEMIYHGYAYVEPTVLSGYIPNIYCLAGMFMLVPLYWLNTNISFKQRIGKTVLMLILFFSFALNIPTYIWHGFHFPNSLSSRESFLYIFLIICMAVQAMERIKEHRYALILGAYAAAIILGFGLSVLFPDTLNEIELLMNALFLTLIMLWAVFTKQGKLPKTLLTVCLLIVVVAELGLNAEDKAFNTSSRSYYVDDNQDIDNLLNSINDADFYRVEKEDHRTKNDGTWSDYRSASVFSSTVTKGITDFYGDMGMESSTNSCSYYGATPVMSAILGVRYEITKDESNDRLQTFVSQSGDLKLYRSKYSLSPAFTVNPDITAEVNMDVKDPFEVQNDFLEAACDAADVFSKSANVSGETINFTVGETGRLFVYITSKPEKMHVKVERSSINIIDKTYTDMKHPRILDLGDVQSGDNITITSEDDEVTSLTGKWSLMSYSAYESAMKNLESRQMELTYFDDTTVSGKVIADRDCCLFTSIPYDKGWTVKVDGEKAEIRSYYDAFILLDLDAGEHVIEFQYRAPGLLIGIIISLAGLIILLLLIMADNKKNRKEEMWY